MQQSIKIKIENNKLEKKYAIKMLSLSWAIR